MIDVLERIKKNVIEKPTNIAFCNEKEVLTYEEIWRLANKYASLLSKLDDGPVVLYGHKQCYMIVGMLACLMSNHAYVPIDSSLPPFRYDSIIDLVKPIAIIDKPLDETLFEEKFKQNREIISSKELEDIAYIMFTSGSTGIPKGVPISRKNLNSFINWISNFEILKDFEDANILNQANFNFDLSVADIYFSLCNGHSLYAYDKTQDVFANLFETIKNHRINIAIMTPMFIDLCLINKDFNECNYDFFKCIFSCGAILDKKTVGSLFKHFPNIKVINAYGPTEATCAISAKVITKEMLDNNKSLPIGDIKTSACDIKIVDNEIILKGDSVFGGYLNDIDNKNCYKETNKNCFKTGDLGFIENDMLYYLKRRDNQFKYKGYRIEIDDIENNLLKIPKIVNAAVVPLMNENNICLGINAYLIVEDKIETTLINEELKKYLPDYMLPRSYYLLESFPMNNNGKIDRKALLEYEKY